MLTETQENTLLLIYMQWCTLWDFTTKIAVRKNSHWCDERNNQCDQLCHHLPHEERQNGQTLFSSKLNRMKQTGQLTMDFVASLFWNYCNAIVTQIILRLYPILTVNNVWWWHALCVCKLERVIPQLRMCFVIILTCKKIRSNLNTQVAEFPLQVMAPQCEPLHSFFSTLAVVSL